MNKGAEVIIVGAGIVGAACALELSTEGLRVLVIDEGFPSAGSTGAAPVTRTAAPEKSKVTSFVTGPPAGRETG